MKTKELKLLDQKVLINPLEEKIEEETDKEEINQFLSEKEQKRRKAWSEYLLTQQPSL